MSALSSAYRVNRTFVLRFISWCTGGPHGPPSRKSCTHARTCTPRHSVMLDTSTASIRDLPAPKVVWRPQDILLQSYRASALWPRVTFLPHLRLLCSWVVNLELQVTRVPLQSGVFPRPKSSGAHGAFSSIRYQAWQQTKKLARVRTLSFLRSRPPFLLLAGAPP